MNQAHAGRPIIPTDIKVGQRQSTFFSWPSQLIASILLVYLLLLTTASPLFGTAKAAETAFTPYFISLRHSTVNVRAGPGTQYPILWAFKRAHLPLEAIDQFENWIQIRYSDGEKGWIHRRLASPERWAIITGTSQVMRRQPDKRSKPTFVAEAGVLGRIKTCSGAWCELVVAERKGWLPRAFLWGVYPHEIID